MTFSKSQALYYLLVSSLPDSLISKRRAGFYAQEWNWSKQEVEEFLESLKKMYRPKKSVHKGSNFTFDECLTMFNKMDILPEDEVYEESESFFSHYEKTEWTYSQGGKRYPIKKLEAAVRSWINRDYNRKRFYYKQTEEYGLMVDTEWQKIYQKFQEGKNTPRKNIRFKENIIRLSELKKEKK